MNQTYEIKLDTDKALEALGYSNTSKSISDHTDEDERYNESLERGVTTNEVIDAR